MKSNTAHHNRIKMLPSSIVFNVIGYLILLAAVIFSLVPFIAMVSGSFTSERSILVDGYSLWPREFSVEAYRLILRNPVTLVRAYGVSIWITVAGSAVGLFITAMTAYVISRKQFKYRYALTFFFYFTTLFNGGLLSIYILFVRYLNLKNSYLSLILPLLINVFNLLVMRTFISSIPESICESAKIDGAGHFTIFMRLILPLSTSSLATIGLYLMLAYWNDWYHAMLYISDHHKYPLQYMLYNVITASEGMQRIAKTASVRTSMLPTNTLKLAMAVAVTGPILLVYPFIQKYFIKGVTVGAVKG